MKNKIPKAKCEKCKHCKYIDAYGYIGCAKLNAHITASKPKRCSYFEKMGGKNNAK